MTASPARSAAVRADPQDPHVGPSGEAPAPRRARAGRPRRRRCPRPRGPRSASRALAAARRRSDCLRRAPRRRAAEHPAALRPVARIAAGSGGRPAPRGRCGRAAAPRAGAVALELSRGHRRTPRAARRGTGSSPRRAGRAGQARRAPPRATRTSPSSSGWRSASRACARNSPQLVQEQHAAMRERDLARPRAGPPPTSAADEAPWWGARNGGAGPPRRRRQRADGRVDARHLERLVVVEVGQHPGSRRASIVLPAPGGPTSSRAWPPAAASSSARRASGCPRTSARSASGARGRAAARRGGLDRALAAEPRHGLGQVLDADAATPRAAPPRRPRRRDRARPRARRPGPSRLRAARRDGPDAGVERELAEAQHPAARSAGTWPVAASSGDGDREVEARAELAQRARGEADGDPAERELELGRGDARADALARLHHRAVGQPHDLEAGTPAGDVGLDLDGHAVEPEEGLAVGRREHRTTLGRGCVTCPAASVPTV